MPLGFFGTAISLVAVAAAIPLVYAFVWPGGVSRIAAFVSITTVVGVIAAVVAFMWLIAPLKGIGISAAPAGSSGDSASLDSILQSRFYIALVALLIIQAALSKGLDYALAR